MGKPSDYREKLRCHASDEGRTEDGPKRKIVQYYSGRQETTKIVVHECQYLFKKGIDRRVLACQFNVLVQYPIYLGEFDVLFLSSRKPK